MNDTKQINSKIIDGLLSNDLTIILYSLNLISETGNSKYIAPVINLLHCTSHPEVKTSIRNLLSELKHTDARNELVNAIKNPEYETNLPTLVSACWENGLDFSLYLSLFVDLVIAKPFEVSFEAFTVIENMEANIDEAIKEIEVGKIKTALAKTVEDDRKHLLQELLKLIPAISA